MGYDATGCGRTWACRRSGVALGHLAEVAAAALRVLGAVQSKADLEAVSAALRAVYLPWVEESARRLQNALMASGGFGGLASHAASGGEQVPTDGVCTVFVDGLRYDVAVALKERLAATSQVDLQTCWTSLPSVTASGKPWCSPVAHLVSGDQIDQGFEPRVAADGKPLSGHNFRKLLADHGIQPLDTHETGDLEWAVRLALEVRRRVKEQQKRIGAAEFRNTHFSYTIGAQGVEKFVSTPELQSQAGIGDEPLECGQVWTLSPGGQDEHPGLFRLEVTEGPGSGVRVLNNPVPSAFKESIRYAEQNLYARAQQLVGNRDPRAHEFSVQLRGFDAAKSGAKTAIAALIALSSALLKKSVRGGLVVVGEVTLGGTIEPIHNAVTLAELAVEKGAKSLLLPVACRRQLFDLSDEMATKLDIEFYQDGRDALLKALVD